MITLYTIPGRDGLESFSPFCMKVEVYLKLAGLEYKADRSGDPRKAPKQKLPWIDDGGTAVPDSGAILEHLEKKHGEPLDKGLDAKQRALGHVIRRTLEESTYFVMLWSRWAEQEGWEKVSSKFFASLPAPLRLFVPGIVRKQVLNSARAQGIGRHKREEIYEHGEKDFAAVSTLIGDTYALDDRIRTTDIIIYSFVANAVRADVDNPMREAVMKDARLMSHLERVTGALARKS